MTRGYTRIFGALAAMLCLAAGGCRRDPYKDAYLDVVYSQQRALEDKLNNLDYEHAIAVEELAEARAKNDELREELGRPGSRRTPASRPSRGTDSPRDTDEGDDSPPALTPPMIERGEPFEPASRRSRQRAMTTSTGGGSDLNKPPTAPANSRVTHIVLNPYRTQGHDFDGQPGDDGIALSFEPRNALDQFVPSAGPVSIVVVDPEAGEAGRIARWDFTAEEIAERLAASGDESPSGGIDFKLPWPKDPPTRAQLRVFVRYTGESDERFETNRAIFLNLPGQFSHRWTPKSARPMQEGAVDVGDVADRPAAPRSMAPAKERLARTPEIDPPTGAEEGTGDSERGPEPQPPAKPLANSPAKPLERPQWKPFR
jgi:hypothetical protein